MSAAPPRLFYDDTCVVCKSFAKLLRKKLDGLVELVPLQESDAGKDFKLELNGETFFGKEAIDTLEKEVPKIREFFWMLPDSYKGKAIYQAYWFGRFLRKINYFFGGRTCGGCE